MIWRAYVSLSVCTSTYTQRMNVFYRFRCSFFCALITTSNNYPQSFISPALFGLESSWVIPPWSRLPSTVSFSQRRTHRGGVHITSWSSPTHRWNTSRTFPSPDQKEFLVTELIKEVEPVVGGEHVRDGLNLTPLTALSSS